MFAEIPNCRTLFRQYIARPLSLARPSTGNNRAARIAMMAITTNSSIKVKPDSQSADGRLETRQSLRKDRTRTGGCQVGFMDRTDYALPPHVWQATEAGTAYHQSR
jgi:hypothetical protein